MSPKMNFQTIPLSQVPADRNSMEPERRVILVVDDERMIADTLTMILNMNGFATLTAYDGMEALELAQIVPPDLLISDVVMPGMTGVELAIALAESAPACRILLFSGQAATVDLLAEARAEGKMFTTLTKPVHPTDLLRCISDSLNLGDVMLQDPAVARGESGRAEMAVSVY